MKRRDFHRIALGIALSPILANTAFAQATGQTAGDPMAAVRKHIDTFNKGDTAGMAAMFAVPGSILDGMAPRVWQGPTAAQDWYRDVLIEGKQHGASEYFVTLGEPLHNNVTGDSAYVVVPAHDIQSAGQADYAIRRSLYGGASQASRWVAHRCLSLGERHRSLARLTLQAARQPICTAEAQNTHFTLSG